jgi:hypothetical protein
MGGSTLRGSALAEPLHRALEPLRLEGAVFLRAEYMEEWALDSQGGPAFAGMLHPGAERVIFFHVVASGRCWVSLADGERHGQTPATSSLCHMAKSTRWVGSRRRRRCPSRRCWHPLRGSRCRSSTMGRAGSLTQVVCGYLHSQDPLFDPRLRALPPVFVVRPPPGPAARWVEANITYALAQSSGGRSEPVSTRLPELLLIELLRLHLATAPAVERGLGGRIARSGARAGDGPAPCRTRTEMDDSGTRRRGRGIAFCARQPLPASPRTIADPLSHRVANAHRPGIAGNHGARRCRDRTARWVRFRRGVQSGVQAHQPVLTRPLAHHPITRRCSRATTTPCRAAGPALRALEKPTSWQQYGRPWPSDALITSARRSRSTCEVAGQHSARSSVDNCYRDQAVTNARQLAYLLSSADVPVALPGA